jgi:hypothetical protein
MVRSTKSPIHRRIYEAYVRDHQSRLEYRCYTIADRLAEGGAREIPRKLPDAGVLGGVVADAVIGIPTLPRFV